MTVTHPVARQRLCLVCSEPVPYNGKGGPRRYCDADCAAAGRRLVVTRYMNSPKYAELLKRNNSSPAARASKARYSAGHPNLVKGSALISKATRNYTLLDQAFRCAICACGIELDTLKVDHDHQTNKVRGLLCGSCNLKMAALDDSRFLRPALAYKAKY